ncbi:hypothetical protein [Rothia mucilaginosa]|nr:hypothetical protein [uncultured Rothia sp.]
MVELCCGAGACCCRDSAVASGEIDHNEMTADLARSKGMVPAED